MNTLSGVPYGANGEPGGIPCQASIEEGVTTNGDECNHVHIEMSTIWKRQANCYVGRDSLYPIMSALHCNLEEHLTKDQYKKIMQFAIKTGCPYFTFNIPNTVCRDCGHISKHRLAKCPKCGSENIDYATRVIGYLKLVSSFSEARQKEEGKRYYANA